MTLRYDNAIQTNAGGDINGVPGAGVGQSGLQTFPSAISTAT
jgi:hypothetical protein